MVQSHRKTHFDEGQGDIWTWTAICADTKLVPSFLVGGRDAGYATEFLQDLAGRLANRVQLNSDGSKVYLQAVEDAFGADIDYAMLVKHYGKRAAAGEKRYSPAVCTGTTQKAITGSPDEKHISTSYVERQNLTMRMSMRGFTRLTNAFSKKIDNHCHSIALHFMYYNFVRIHQTLRTTPRWQRASLTSCGTSPIWSRCWIRVKLDLPEILPEIELKNAWGHSHRTAYHPNDVRFDDIFGGPFAYVCRFLLLQRLPQTNAC